VRKFGVHFTTIAVAIATLLARAPLGEAQQPQWKFAAPAPEAMGELYGTSLGGKMYVLGGLDTTPNRHTPMGYNWEYDPATDKWTVKKPMARPAHHVMIAPYQNKFYVFGGFVRPQEFAAWQPINDAWVYDPANDSWQALAPMPTPRGAGQAVELGGKIYVIGGAHSNEPGNPGAPIGLGSPAQVVVGTVEVYDPATNAWQTRTPMPTGRNHFLAAAANGKVYAVDGRIGTCFVTKSGTIDLVEEYDPSSDRWQLASRDIVPRGDISGGVHDGLIYAAGAEGQNAFWKYTSWLVDAFDPKSGEWRMLPHMQIARHGFAAAIVGNQLHVVGGSFQSDGMPEVSVVTNTHEVFDLAR